MYYKQNLPVPFDACCGQRPGNNQNRPVTLPSFGGTPIPPVENCCEPECPKEPCRERPCSCQCGGQGGSGSSMLLLLLLFMR